MMFWVKQSALEIWRVWLYVCIILGHSPIRINGRKIKLIAIKYQGCAIANASDG